MYQPLGDLRGLVSATWRSERERLIAEAGSRYTTDDQCEYPSIAVRWTNANTLVLLLDGPMRIP